MHKTGALIGPIDKNRKTRVSRLDVFFNNSCIALTHGTHSDATVVEIIQTCTPNGSSKVDTTATYNTCRLDNYNKTQQPQMLQCQHRHGSRAIGMPAHDQTTRKLTLSHNHFAPTITTPRPSLRPFQASNNQ